MTETDTKHLIVQAARELQLENVTVEPSVDQPGFYEVNFRRDRMRTEEERQLLARFYETVTATIPMGAEFKNIINTLKASVADDTKVV